MKWLLLAPLPVIALVMFVANAPSRDASAMHECTLPAIFGDLNDNDQIDLVDAQLEKDAALGRETHPPCGPYDVDCDGAIKVADANKIKQAALGHPYHQNEPCPDIGSVLPHCIDFPVNPPCTPGPTPGTCIDFNAGAICPTLPPGRTPEPPGGSTPEPCIDFSAGANCGPFSR